MARGVELIEFDFLLCDVIPIEVTARIMFGEVKSICPRYQGQTLNITEYLFDDENDFITLEDYLIELAQEYYDEKDLEIILEIE